MLSQVEESILELAASAWIYPAMYVSATIDGFFPPIPSESVIITLTVLAHASGNPWLPGILLLAALGAWTGDQIAYQIGRTVGTERVRFLRSRRGRKAVEWARQALSRRGASFIIGARYIPIGRVAVNMTAGAVGYPRARFMLYSAIAAVTWSIYSMLIGLAAGAWLGHNPLLAMAVGVVTGVLLGLVVDQVVQRLLRTGRGGRAQALLGGSVPDEDVPDGAPEDSASVHRAA
ncbi:DedA family protein [Isoptericola sp. NEAU-Y5]|uniref:DedA family protein n=2 Tax=Isoptericola luteus TaxID=2879484 RepID=A0ABS7ZDU7_9MICO|nr:DedA family protein [Isoptericola sp. NEAU-Y5]